MSIFVPHGNESALKITPFFKSIEKKTESRFSITSSSDVNLNDVTATLDGVKYGSIGSLLSLHEMKTVANVAEIPVMKQRRWSRFLYFTVLIFGGLAAIFMHVAYYMADIDRFNLQI